MHAIRTGKERGHEFEGEQSIYGRYIRVGERRKEERNVTVL